MKPTILVLHSTEGYGREYLDKLFSGQIKRDGKQKISVHWAVYRSGDVVEYTPWRPGEALRCIHAGVSSWKGRTSCNGWSLGCEIEHVQGNPYPEPVIQAVCDLVRMVHREYPDMELVHHYDISPGRKIDPTSPWKTAVLPRVLAAWNQEEEGTLMALTDEEQKLLLELTKRNRLSLLAAMNTDDIAIALAEGDLAKARRLLEEANAAAKTERARLGLK
jgi:AmpD protein